MPPLITLKDLFNFFIKHAYAKNKRNPHFDGRAYWQPIKRILAELTWQASKWRTIPIRYTSKIMSIFEFGIDGNGRKIMIEKNHFIIQTVRIPTNERPSIRKIMQIALNIGQCLATNNSSLLHRKKLSDYILKRECMTPLSTLIPAEKLKLLLRHI